MVGGHLPECNCEMCKTLNMARLKSEVKKLKAELEASKERESKLTDWMISCRKEFCGMVQSFTASNLFANTVTEIQKTILEIEELLAPRTTNKGLSDE